MASNFLLSYFAAPLIERLIDTRFWTIYRGLERGDASDAGAGRAASALPELLRVAEQVPYWKATLESVGIVPSEQSDHALLKAFSLIPISTKQAYISGFPDQVTVPGKRDNWQYCASASGYTINRRHYDSRGRYCFDGRSRQSIVLYGRLTSYGGAY